MDGKAGESVTVKSMNLQREKTYRKRRDHSISYLWRGESLSARKYDLCSPHLYGILAGAQWYWVLSLLPSSFVIGRTWITMLKVHWIGLALNVGADKTLHKLDGHGTSFPLPKSKSKCVYRRTYF